MVALSACSQGETPGDHTKGTGGSAPGAGTGNSAGAPGSGGSGNTGTGGGTAGGAAAGGTTGGVGMAGSSTSSGGTAPAAGTGSASGGGAGVSTGSGGTSAGGSPGAGGAGSGGTGSGGMSGTDAGGMSSMAGTGGTGPTVCMPPTVNLTGNDAVAGTLVTFNDNGGWCWYQDERVIVDAAGKKMVVGSVASGGSRDGNVEAVVYDLATGMKSQPAKLGHLSVDDHAAAAFALRPDGKYVAMWAGHRVDCNSYYSVYDGSAWSAQKAFDWKSQGCPWDNDSTHMITYSNLWYMSSEQRFYSGVRSVSTSPNFLDSTDNGDSFSYYGRLSSTPTTGYVAGYYKYWGNGVDRIDFVGTEAHPRDNDNNLWHGYVKGGKVYNSAGTVVDDSVADKTGQNIDKFTKLFATGSSLGGVKLSHAWNADLVRYDDGTIALIWTARANTTSSSDDPDLRLNYARYDGMNWSLTYLVKAGPKLYSDEQDYTGLGALVPDDPHTIYISTPYDPRDDKTMLGHREIWQGTTCDNGQTFTWTPVTANSTKDNIRPVVPKWDANHRALLWLRGTYNTAQKYTETVVGVISGQ
jgi:hypothetical protein